jgi:ParB-like chromosome segregation protein Spo0J
MQIEQIDIEDLIPYAMNARTHSDAQVAQIAGSIKEFGFNNPVLIDAKNGLIAGHGRVMAGRKLGLKQVPAIRLGHLTDLQRKAYILADNKIALNSGWDYELLKIEIEDLDSNDYQLDILGFSLEEIEQITVGEQMKQDSPDDFKDVDEADLEHKCPKCGFEFDE